MTILKEKTVKELQKGDTLFNGKDKMLYTIENILHDEENECEYFVMRGMNQIKNTFNVHYSVMRRMFNVGKSGIIVVSN